MRLQSGSKRQLPIGAAVGAILLVIALATATGVAVADDQDPVSPSAAPADPADKGGQLLTSVENPEELAKQEKLDSYVDPLLNSGLLEAADGFGGSAVDYDDNAFDLWWRGEVPDDVQPLLDDFGDVEVRLHEAKYTAQEIEDAARTVARYSSDRFDIGLISVESLARPTPVHGIEVGVTKKADLPGNGVITDTAIAKELTEVAGIPVSVDESLRSFPW